MTADHESDQTIVQRGQPIARAPIVHAVLVRELEGPPRRITLGETKLQVGRAPANDIVLASPEVSRQHCQIELAGNAATLTDLNSTNGVYVDGHRVEGAAQLHRGAVVALGPFTLTYVCGLADELATAEDEAREEARAVSYIQALLPAPLRDGPVLAEWRFVPSARLGGDAFGYRWLDEGRFAAFLLDVCGHGIGSALLAVSAANMLRASVLGADPGDPVAVLHAANTAFQMDHHNDLFFSLWYGVYDRYSRRLRFASAGHHPAYLSDGPALAALGTRAPCIGMAPAVQFTMAEAVAPVGSRLYLFSDGAFELSRVDGRLGTIEDLIALIAEPGNEQTEPDRLFDAIRQATGRRPLEDDVSLVAIEFR